VKIIKEESFMSCSHEASGAYKNIATVIKEQSDLVEPIIELKPLAVIKG
jgi:tRNA-splicing ligase RtcB